MWTQRLLFELFETGFAISCQMKVKEFYCKLCETAFARTHYQMKIHVTLAHDRRNTNPVCKGLYFWAIHKFFSVTHVRID